jgi:hypothetical protein
MALGAAVRWLSTNTPDILDNKETVLHRLVNGYQNVDCFVRVSATYSLPRRLWLILADIQI